MVKLLLGGTVTALILLVITLRAKARLRTIEASDGCVSCDSPNVEVRDGTLFCRACHYEGAVDRGGKLDPEILDGMFDHK